MSPSHQGPTSCPGLAWSGLRSWQSHFINWFSDLHACHTQATQDLNRFLETLRLSLKCDYLWWEEQEHQTQLFFTAWTLWVFVVNPPLMPLCLPVPMGRYSALWRGAVTKHQPLREVCGDGLRFPEVFWFQLWGSLGMENKSCIPY